MVNNNSSNVWIWGVIRRCYVHAIVGAIVAALIGSLCVGLAGVTIGSVLVFENNSFSQSDTTVIFGYKVPLVIAVAIFGGTIGLSCGGLTGGIVGFIGYAVVGIVTPPSNPVFPAKIVITSMLKFMSVATFFALICFFVWCAIFGAIQRGFFDTVGEGLQYAVIGIPALMAIGQIAGIWSGTTKLGKQNASPVSAER